MKNIDLKKIQTLTTNDLMRTENLTPQYSELGFSRDDIDGLIEIALDVDLELSNSSVDKERYIPCHALTALGQFEEIKPFDEILERLEFFEDDDYYREAVLYYLRKVSYLKLDDLIEYFLDRTKKLGLRLLVLEGIEEAFKNDTSLNDRMVEVFVEFLQRDDELDDMVNAVVIFMLIDMTEDKYIDLIRKVFDTKPVDVFYDGDLEDIEIKLGLREKRSKPREKNIFQKILEMEELMQPIISTEPKIKRNEPCPCGSGKKYKKCCLNK